MSKNAGPTYLTKPSIASCKNSFKANIRLQEKAHLRKNSSPAAVPTSKKSILRQWKAAAVPDFSLLAKSWISTGGRGVSTSKVLGLQRGWPGTRSANDTILDLGIFAL